MKGLLIIEHENQLFNPVNLNVMTAALKLNIDFDALVIGHQLSDVIQSVQSMMPVKKILKLEHEDYHYPLAERLGKVISEQAQHYQYILAPATTFGKNVLPYAAGLSGVELISDVCEILANDTFKRPIYAGNLLETVQHNGDCKFLTIRPISFESHSQEVSSEPEMVELSAPAVDQKSKFVSLEQTQSERPDLQTAKVVVSGGRALKSAENFKLMDELAIRMNAAVGATRAAVDAGYVPNDYQVGQTGKIVAPDLYFAIGISGAVQHLAGMKNSKIIVAINKDPNAPIFKVAHYGMVGDLFDIVPELIKELDQRRS